MPDDPRELLVVVDEDDQVLELRPRAEVHGDPRRTLHRSVAVVVETPGGTLWQRRGPDKDTDPGAWDLACTGHAGADDVDAGATVRRELDEELGILDGEPELAGRLLVDLPDERELVSVFRLHHPGPFRLAPPELSALAVLPAGERPVRLSAFAERVLAWLDAGAPGRPAG